MADPGEPLPSQDAAPAEATRLDDIEQDLDNVDEALAALDSGDLETAETLAAELVVTRRGCTR